MPVSNLIPAAAAIAPAMAETGARIGNCRFHAVGRSGNGHNKHGVTPGTIVVTCPSSPNTPASIIGFRCRTHSAFMAKRSGNNGGAIEDNIGLRNQLSRVLFAEIRVHRQHFQPWIQFAQSFCCAFHTWLADPIVRDQDLSIQIVRPQIAGMGENQPADPRRRQIVADRPSQTATATDERSGAVQSLLSRLAEAGYLKLPSVRLVLGIGEVVGNRHCRAIG